MYEELSTVQSIQCSINDNYMYYTCLMDGPVPNGVISQFIGIDILNEKCYYVSSNLYIMWFLLGRISGSIKFTPPIINMIP